ncbi:hypothetical protein RJ639_024905 [Escallonia herrerae]|uniref:Uncharacterized protein n=1 Tax=Escallonia herrerae TaxID=1293975 RepID=A0AA88UY42_9ASTE|nr:hypothetical protein RJ639_024905 [Escallonia herrerae]
MVFTTVGDDDGGSQKWLTNGVANLDQLAIHGLSLFRRTTLPPGPCGLPLAENLFAISPKPHESLAKLAKKHRPVMTIRLGSLTTVVVSSPALTREIQ